MHPGDRRLYDRGFVDGADITYLKQERGVDVCTGLKADMNLLKAAIVAAQANPGAWKAHPTRKGQKIQLIGGLSGLWPQLGVPMNVCVIRWVDKQTGEIGYIGLATTELSLSATQVVHRYQTRPEIEED